MENKNITILIADDEPSIREAVKSILVSEDYRVVSAKDGKEAVELFKKESPDLIILDVVMPRMSGFEALEKIKRFFMDRYVPIIFLTASIKVDHKLKALHGGAVDYLTKPVSPEELLARVRNFLNIKSQHDELKKAAVYDWMTGAMNKGHFMEKAKEELSKAVRNKTPLSFIFMDIDHFKKINDEVGHLGGDFVISEFGKRLKKAIRNIDLLGRFGGDEFTIMLPHKPKKEALVVAGRIKKVVSSVPIIFERKKIIVTASQGVVSLDTKNNVKIEHLLKLADEALYEAKENGGNCYMIKEVE